MHHFHDRPALAGSADHEPMPGVVDPFHRQQPRHDIEHAVDRNREANALGAGPDGHVDADHLAVDVEQRAP